MNLRLALVKCNDFTWHFIGYNVKLQDASFYINVCFFFLDFGARKCCARFSLNAPQLFSD